jgi:hypothetical protein
MFNEFTIATFKCMFLLAALNSTMLQAQTWHNEKHGNFLPTRFSRHEVVKNGIKQIHVNVTVKYGQVKRHDLSLDYEFDVMGNNVSETEHGWHDTLNISTLYDSVCLPKSVTLKQWGPKPYTHTYFYSNTHTPSRQTMYRSDSLNYKLLLTDSFGLRHFLLNWGLRRMNYMFIKDPYNLQEDAQSNYIIFTHLNEVNKPVYCFYLRNPFNIATADTLTFEMLNNYLLQNWPDYGDGYRYANPDHDSYYADEVTDDLNIHYFDKKDRLKRIDWQSRSIKHSFVYKGVLRHKEIYTDDRRKFICTFSYSFY